jgi:glycosyltransferase involved in cell wall biosynthesis
MNLAKLFHKKLVLHIHGGGFKDYYYEKTNYVTQNLKKCDVIIVLSQEWKDFLNSVGFDCVIVENVITEPVVRDVPHDDMVHFLFLGLIRPLKGIYDLVEMIAEHKAELRGKMVLHVGGNGETSVLVNMIKDLDVEDIVKFEGWVTDEKKIDLMNKCKVYILPSYVEGLPLSILEAMSYNMAIISTRVGGIPSLVNDGKNGFLFEPGDKNAIYSSVKTLVYNKELLLSMGKDNSKRVVDFYPDHVAKKLTELYKSII